MAVPRSGHSEHDNELPCFLRLRNLYITWSIKTSQVALYSMELQNTQNRRNVRAVLPVAILRRIPTQCGH